MRLTVLLKNDCNDTSQQNFFFLCLVTDQIPRRKICSNIELGLFIRIQNKSDPDLDVQSNKSVKT